MDAYSRTYEIRWSDIDANGHVNYAAYIDAAGDLRYQFFIEHGFPPEKFKELGVGPIYTAIHAQFLREVRMGHHHLCPVRSCGKWWAVEGPS
jgi:acyl-CoA thioester hydrolase